MWDYNLSANANRSNWNRFFEFQDRAAVRTAGLGPTLRVPALDWLTKLSEMQERFPPWINELIANSPVDFNEENRAWNTITAHARRQK